MNNAIILNRSNFCSFISTTAEEGIDRLSSLGTRICSLSGADSCSSLLAKADLFTISGVLSIVAVSGVALYALSKSSVSKASISSPSGLTTLFPVSLEKYSRIEKALSEMLYDEEKLETKVADAVNKRREALYELHGIICLLHPCMEEKMLMNKIIEEIEESRKALNKSNGEISLFPNHIVNLIFQ